YPYGMIFFFGCLGLYFTSQFARENSDAFYTATLPIKKRHVVKSKCLLFVSIEIAQLIICIPFSIIRLWTLPDGNPVGIEANVAYFGFGLIVYAIYNFLYLTVLFGSSYQVGKAFVIAIIPTTAVIALMEYSVHLPAFAWLDSIRPGDLVRQLPLLAAGILVYIAGNLLAYRTASRAFERADL
ncbi:ABC-2 transporter permease, partial [uncultured Subdoligranulum sp.]|uniref:ABC-2 transporter permease n=1 Tax=uncultured Subdoligranulum sp. TaxID=512298 RepID=UPI002613639C